MQPVTPDGKPLAPGIFALSKRREPPRVISSHEDAPSSPHSPRPEAGGLLGASSLETQGREEREARERRGRWIQKELNPLL